MDSGVFVITKEGVASNLGDLFTNILVQIRRETLLDKFTYRFICDVVFFARRGSGFIPKKGLPLPPYQGVVHECSFAVRVNLVPQCISMARLGYTMYI